MKRRLITCLLLVWGMPLYLQAQNAPKRVDFEFTVMGTETRRDIGYAQLKPEAMNKPRPVAADFDIIPLRVSSQGRSKRHRYRGLLPLRFVEIQETGDGSWRATRMLAAVNNNSVPPRALILLTPDPVDKAKLKTVLVDDTSVSFPARHIRVINLSQVPVEGQISGRSFFTDNVHKLLPPQRVDGSARVGVAYSKNGRVTVVFDQSLSVGANSRVMLVFLPPFRSGADIRVRVVRDKVAGSGGDG